MTYNYRFVTNTPQPRINSFNFAVNGRCYYPSATGAYYNSNLLYTNGTNVPTAALINGDTALGMPHMQ